MPNFKEGDLVRSTYRGRWIAVVLGVQKRKDQNPLYDVRIVLEPNGRPMCKMIRARVTQIDESWLRGYTPRSSVEAEVIQVWSNPTAKWAQLPESARSLPRAGGF